MIFLRFRYTFHQVTDPEEDAFLLMNSRKIPVGIGILFDRIQNQFPPVR